MLVAQGVALAEEDTPLREQSFSGVSFNAKDIRERGIYDISDLTTIVPGLFIPSYGSAQATAMYLRGVGSYSNTPAVGLYVDDIPWLESSSFHTRISEVDRIEVLRGPQNTLYGGNTMGGLIRITTKNPIDYQGTFIERSMANHRSHYTSISHYLRFSEKLGFTAGVGIGLEGSFSKTTIQVQELMPTNHCVLILGCCIVPVRWRMLISLPTMNFVRKMPFLIILNMFRITTDTKNK